VLLKHLEITENVQYMSENKVLWKIYTLNMKLKMISAILQFWFWCKNVTLQVLKETSLQK